MPKKKRHNEGRRSIRLNGDLLRELYKDKGFTIESLAAATAETAKNLYPGDSSMGGISTDTISKALAGEGIDSKSALILAKTLGKEIEDLKTGKQVLSATSFDDDRVIFRGRIDNITFEVEAPSKSPPDQLQAHANYVFAWLEKAGFMKNDVRNPQGISGSIIVSGEITKADAARIMKAFLQGKLKELGVTEITFGEPVSIAGSSETLPAEPPISDSPAPAADSTQQNVHKPDLEQMIKFLQEEIGSVQTQIFIEHFLQGDALDVIAQRHGIQHDEFVHWYEHLSQLLCTHFGIDDFSILLRQSTPPKQQRTPSPKPD
jgi:hypothetical protein